MAKKKSISIEDIESAIMREEYMKIGTKMTACLLTLENGHEVVGMAGCVDAKSYDIDIGKPFARAKAVEQLWPLFGYALQQKLYDESLS